MSKDWDWESPEAKMFTAIPQAYAVAVYQDGKGNVVIRQQEQYGSDEDAIIVFDAKQARSVADKILQVIGEL